MLPERINPGPLFRTADDGGSFPFVAAAYVKAPVRSFGFSYIPQIIRETYIDRCMVYEVAGVKSRRAFVQYPGCFNHQMGELRTAQSIVDHYRNSDDPVTAVLPRIDWMIDADPVSWFCHMPPRIAEGKKLKGVLDRLTPEQKRYLPPQLVNPSAWGTAETLARLMWGAQQYHKIIYFTEGEYAGLPNIPATAPLMDEAAPVVAGYAHEVLRRRGIKEGVLGGFSFGVEPAAWSVFKTPIWYTDAAHEGAPSWHPKPEFKLLGVMLCGAPLIKEACKGEIFNRDAPGILVLRRKDPIPGILGYDGDRALKLLDSLGITGMELLEPPGGHIYPGRYMLKHAQGFFDGRRVARPVQRPVPRPVARTLLQAA